MNTDIRITVTGEGDLSTNITEVPIVTGNTVSFTLAPGSASAALCMTARTAGALSLPSGSNRVEVASGSPVSFQFAAPPPGEYWLMVAASDQECDPNIQDYLGGSAPMLEIGLASSGGGIESGPGDGTRPKRG